jgi:UDP-N-acetylmuramate dehydrogenase
MSSDISVLITQLRNHGLEVDEQVPLAPMTTYGVGGNAACVVKVTALTIESCASILCRHPQVPVIAIGRGSNLLVSDNGFSGVVVRLVSHPDEELLNFSEEFLTVAASVPMPVLARRSVKAKRTGLEWCVGIPGSVGAAVRMNAGGHGADMLDSLVSVDVVSLRSGELVTVSAQDLGLHFRGSALAAHHVVVSATLRAPKSKSDVPLTLIDEIVVWRRDNQPGGRNAGSVFVNPAPGSGSAGALIDDAELRGFTIGGAQTSEKHANFIQAADGAKSQDIIDVMSHVQSVVREKHGVTLYSEVVLVGFDAAVMSRFSDPRHGGNERVDASRRLAELLGENL